MLVDEMVIVSPADSERKAQEHYVQFLQDYPGLEARVSQYHIASYLGIMPESLSRIRASLKPR